MTQTRTFLLFAWLMVAALLWMEWTKERQLPRPAVAPGCGRAPAGRCPPARFLSTCRAARRPRWRPRDHRQCTDVTLMNDVRRCSSMSAHTAPVLAYPQTRKACSPPSCFSTPSAGLRRRAQRRVAGTVCPSRSGQPEAWVRSVLAIFRPRHRARVANTETCLPVAPYTLVACGTH